MHVPWLFFHKLREKTDFERLHDILVSEWVIQGTDWQAKERGNGVMVLPSYSCLYMCLLLDVSDCLLELSFLLVFSLRKSAYWKKIKGYRIRWVKVFLISSLICHKTYQNLNFAFLTTMEACIFFWDGFSKFFFLFCFSFWWQ